MNALTQPDGMPGGTGAPGRVLVFIHSLAGGGAERVAVDLCAYWAKAGREVMLVTQADTALDAYPIDPAVRRCVLNTAGLSGGGLSGLWSNVKRVRALRKVLVSFKPDVVLGMMTTASVLAVLAARGLPCAVIATEHTHPPSQTLSGLWRRLRRLTYPHAQQVVALTQGTAAWLSEHVPGSRLAVIPNPVHWPLPAGEPMIPPPDRRAGRCLLAVGRLHRDKGFDVLIDAYSRVAGDFPDWHLVILGEGTERADLTARIAQAGLVDRVSLPGRAGNVGDWYGAADLYVLSSRFEGLSNTLLEAMASGLMPVSFDCETGPREIVRAGIDGLLVRPAGDAGALAEALARAMRDAVGREAMASRATDVRERFAPARVLAMWQDVFDMACRERKGAPGSSGTTTRRDA